MNDTDKNEPDDDEEADDDGPPSIPGVVVAAGVIWIIVGSLSLINMVATFALGGANANPNQRGGVCCAGLFGIAFTVCGYQTVTGKAKDTLGNSIGSMLLGLLEIGIAVLLALAWLNVIPRVNPAGLQLTREMLILIVGLVGLLGTALVLAAILGLSGRSAYAEYRRATAPRSRRRRRRRRDDDDEEYERD